MSTITNLQAAAKLIDECDDDLLAAVAQLESTQTTENEGAYMTADLNNKLKDASTQVADANSKIEGVQKEVAGIKAFLEERRNAAGEAGEEGNVARYEAAIESIDEMATKAGETKNKVDLYIGAIKDQATAADTLSRWLAEVTNSVEESRELGSDARTACAAALAIVKAIASA